MLENMSITGITPLDQYPDKKLLKCCKQFLSSINVCIPCQKPIVESINEVKVTLCVNRYKTLETILGPKILINGTSQIKVIYTAKNMEQSIHSAHFEIPFCQFILVDEFCYEDCEYNLDSIFVGLEDVSIDSCSERCIGMSILYIICPKFYPYRCSQKCDPRYNDYPKNNQKCYTADKCEVSKCNNINTYYLPINHSENNNSHNCNKK